MRVALGLPSLRVALLVAIGTLCVLVAASSARAQSQGVSQTYTDASLFRATITVETTYARDRLASFDVRILQEDGTDATPSLTVVADGETMEALARLGYSPSHVDELGALLEHSLDQSDNTPYEVRAELFRLMSGVQARALSSVAEGPAEAGRFGSHANDELPRVDASLQALSPDAIRVLSVLQGEDADDDGLTDTEEAWWCTNPERHDSDGDGASDGDEISELRAWLGNERPNPPSTDKPFAYWPPQIPSCRDDDHDGIPDLAERWHLGLHMGRESTDGDKYDDGQELFGRTYCPGSADNCGYGQLPRDEDWGTITAEMPRWVESPGDHPFVAAFPVPEIDIVPSSFRVTTVTEIQTAEMIAEGTERTYSTARTEGTSKSETDTETWNEWQEITRTEFESSGDLNLGVASVRRDESNASTGNSEEPAVAEVIRTGTALSVEGCDVVFNVCSLFVKGGDFAGALFNWVAEPVVSEPRVYTPEAVTPAPNEIQSSLEPNSCKKIAQELTCEAQVNGARSARRNALNTVRDEAGAAAQEGHSLRVSSPTGSQHWYYQRGFDLTVPVLTSSEAVSKGNSHGKSRSVTHAEYEEHTVTNAEAFSNEHSWTNATAANSAHAADLRFTYEVANAGTEYARRIEDLAFNIYIGNDEIPITTYIAHSENGSDGAFTNFLPGNSIQITSDPISLSLEQMKAIDTGFPFRIVIEDFAYGLDELFYNDSVKGGIQLAIEDGTHDGDEAVDSYLVPTWGEETLLDVLARYFPHETDAFGFVTAIWTPEPGLTSAPAWCDSPRQVGRTLWCRHALSTADWWNVYMDGLDVGDGSQGFQATDAVAESTALFRFNADGDLDGYSDRTEVDLGTDPNDPASHPAPELRGGLHKVTSSDRVTATLSLQNRGPYDALGVEAVMVAPDDTVTINDNTVGGAGRVPALDTVVVGSLVRLGELVSGSWLAATHASPSVSGYYDGMKDRTYLLTVNCPDTGGCEVGTGSWNLDWDDGLGDSGSASYDAGYSSPSFLPIGTLGVELALLSGRVHDGDTFTVEALTPRDTFRYQINSEPHTPPEVIVSYNTPQGNFRFITPVELITPTQSLSLIGEDMLPGVGVEIVATEAVTTGLNTLKVIASNPSGATFEDAHVIVEFIDKEGAVVHQASVTETLETGPSLVEVPWDTGDFDPAYDGEAEYIALVFWTDHEGNILDTTGRPLSTFQEDPRAELATTGGSQLWDFGEVKQGSTLQHRFPLGNVGFGALHTWVSEPTGVSVEPVGVDIVAPTDARIYEVTLNTSALPLGAYSETVEIRTSHLETLTRTLMISGAITAGAPDVPAGSYEMPLVWSAEVSGDYDEGDWVNFTHSLGPDPSSLHPAAVYSADYATLWGFGEYATALDNDTAASIELFGDGRHGDLIVDGGDTWYADSSRTSIAGTASSGQAQLALSSSSGYVAGDKVLIHQTQGAGAGNWEIGTVASVDGVTLTLSANLENTYSDGGDNQAQAIEIPQHDDCTVSSGGTVTAHAWDGDKGGIAPLMCRGELIIAGEVDVSGDGFRGADKPENQARASGKLGESYDGDYNAVATSTANNYSGGGGAWNNGADAGSGGGGGGYGTAGQTGVLGHSTGGSGPGEGGDTVGSGDLTEAIFPGGGGGSGSNSYTSGGGTDFGGAGGAGGGLILLASSTVQITGTVTAHGSDGSDSTGHVTGGGGAGAGGGILVRARTASLGSSKVAAEGGIGGHGGAFSIDGGDGGDGRVRVEYCDSTDGTTVPSASEHELTCHIVEQVPTIPFTSASLEVPESFDGSRTYQVRYGRRLVFSGAEEETSSIRVPAGALDSALIDVLVSNVETGGDLTISLDIGDDDSWDWQTTQTITGSLVITDTQLAHAFNRYWASSGAPASGDHDVPIRVALSKGGEVLLSHARIAPAASRVRYINIPARTYSSVTIDVSVGDSGSGSLAFGADVGDDGVVNWAHAVSTTLPVDITSANIASAFNDFLVGLSGDVEVPVRFYMSPNEAITVTGYSAVPVETDPDLRVTAGDITYSAATPLEGETVAITTTVHNDGNLEADGVVAAYFAELSDGREWYIGSAFVDQVAAGDSAEAVLSWDTTGFFGPTPIRVAIDPTDRVAESDEEDNEASSEIEVTFNSELHASPIRDLRISNVTDTSFTVSWTTDVPLSGEVRLVSGPGAPSVWHDQRGAGTVAKTQHVTVSGLTPGEDYAFDVLAGLYLEDMAGTHHEVTTGTSVTRHEIDTIWGRVLGTDGETSAAGALVYLTLSDGDGAGTLGSAGLRSALVGTDGIWSLDLARTRSSDGGALFSYDLASGDRLHVEAQLEPLVTGCLETDTAHDDPVAVITLGSSTCLTVAEVEVTPGWNFLSLPVELLPAQTAAGLCAEMASQGLSIAEVTRWRDGGWQGHICGLPFSDFTIELGGAYFLRADAAGSLQLAGAPVVNAVELSLTPGWTPVSLPHTKQMSAEGLCGRLEAEGLNPVEVDRWRDSGWDGHRCGGTVHDFALLPGRGYFVRTEQGGTVVP